MEEVTKGEKQEIKDKKSGVEDQVIDVTERISVKDLFSNQLTQQQVKVFMPTHTYS